MDADRQHEALRDLDDIMADKLPPLKRLERALQDQITYIGLDIGAAELAACMIDAEGSILAEAIIGNCSSEVAAFIQEYARNSSPVVGMEAGSLSSGLARKLRQAGYSVHVFDTRQASKFLSIRRNKTDKNDARGIADIARLGRQTVQDVYVKSIECQQLRSSLVMRHKLIRQRVGGETAIRAIFRLNHGVVKAAASAIGLRRSVLAEIERIRLVEGVDLSAEILPVLDICESIRIHLKGVDRSLKKRAAELPQCRKFMEIPGVGFVTALSFYSAVEDPQRFSTVQDIGAYFGLTPSVESSGISRRDGGISRMGNKLTRTHLVTAASVMLNLKLEDCALYEWASSLAGRIGSGKARVALARKLAIVMLSMWRNGESYRASGHLGADPSDANAHNKFGAAAESEPPTV